MDTWWIHTRILFWESSDIDIPTSIKKFSKPAGTPDAADAGPLKNIKRFYTIYQSSYVLTNNPELHVYLSQAIRCHPLCRI
jgi:hypothetical protein